MGSPSPSQGFKGHRGEPGAAGLKVSMQIYFNFILKKAMSLSSQIVDSSRCRRKNKELEFDKTFLLTHFYEELLTSSFPHSPPEPLSARLS